MEDQEFEAQVVEDNNQQKKSKYITNKERFEYLEAQMAGVTAALDRLTTMQAGTQPNTAPHPGQDHNGTFMSPPLLSRASTPKQPATVRRALINNFSDPYCAPPMLTDPLLSNVDLLNDENTKRHVDNISKAAAARLPRSSGKPTYDIFLNKVVAYEMPWHFLGTHSQRRIRALDSHDELLLSEFVQGYVAMILRGGMDGPHKEAMIHWLGKLGEALIDYRWEDLRDWINAVLHEVGQGRLSWLDDKAIFDQLNATKLRASMKQRDDPTIPICAHFNQGRCSHQSSHDSFKHICALCWLTNGAQHAHPVTTCRRKGGSQQQGNNNRPNYRDSTQQGGTGTPGSHNRHYNSNNSRDNGKTYFAEGNHTSSAKN